MSWLSAACSDVITLCSERFWSICDAAGVKIISLYKCNRMSYQLQLPLPLPNYLVIFGLGDWNSYSMETTMSVELFLSPDVKSQEIGKLSKSNRSLVWEGEWRLDLLMASLKQAETGAPAKILLTINGQVAKGRFTSSTPARKCGSLGPLHSSFLQAETISPLLESDIVVESPSPDVFTTGKGQGCSSDSVSIIRTTCFIQLSPLPKKQLLLASKVSGGQKRNGDGLKGGTREILGRLPKETLRRNLEHFTGKSHQNSQDDGVWGRVASTWRDRAHKKIFNNKLKISHMVFGLCCLLVCPSPRWNHAMCLSDPKTAVLIGGEGYEHQHCRDPLWKLEIENGFWFPMDSSLLGPAPQLSRGHTATYDPETKRIFVFGGMKQEQHNDMYILDTMTWKWSVVAAKGKVPTLAFHSATIYQKELFVFGGVFPQLSSEVETCSNTLLIFNPDYELWYQPLVEGEKPLSRFGHSATLLRNKLVIFGGKRSPAFLNDVYILDLGFMEYISVRTNSPQPSPRGFHAAVPVSDHKALISGGCNITGVLWDTFIFNVGKVFNIFFHELTDTNKDSQEKGKCCTILVFGGSDGNEKFYNDMVKICLDLEKMD
nr:PREDICTED: uncharacterized protein LOC102357299 [Latimeria chalumnae]|eukprot:XP_005986595.2 PREDICTED: uncharacterized protein LOC102357299 [Latimeria chalumnae]